MVLSSKGRDVPGLDAAPRPKRLEDGVWTVVVPVRGGPDVVLPLRLGTCRSALVWLATEHASRIVRLCRGTDPRPPRTHRPPGSGESAVQEEPAAHAAPGLLRLRIPARRPAREEA